MTAVPFHYIDLRAFAYATESEQRVAEALRTYLPEDVELERAESEGHFGDSIVVLSARVERADEMRHVLGRIAGLDERLRETVLDELADRVDENCAFYLTLSKQAAYRGEVALGKGITLRSKVEAYPAEREKAIENAREAIEALG